MFYDKYLLFNKNNEGSFEKIQMTSKMLKAIFLAFVGRTFCYKLDFKGGRWAATRRWIGHMIIVNLDVELAKNKMKLSELAYKIGLTLPNLSIIKTGKAKGVRFATLEKICEVLNCQPGDLLRYQKNGNSFSVWGTK